MKIDGGGALDRRAGMVEPAGKQNLLGQLVDFSDVSRNLLVYLRVRPIEPELDRHAKARERRPQFVAGIGQQRLLRLQQGFDAFGGGVESARNHRDLVVADDVDSRRERAGAPSLDPGAQPLEPPGEPRGDGKRGEPDAADDNEHDRQHAPPRARHRRTRPREHDAPVGEIDAHDARGEGRFVSARREHDRFAARCDERSVGVVERNVGCAELMAQSPERLLDRPRGTVSLEERQVREMEVDGGPALAGSFSDQPQSPPTSTATVIRLDSSAR